MLILRGTDFQNSIITIIYDSLFAAALAAFILKRWQFYRIKSTEPTITS